MNETARRPRRGRRLLGSGLVLIAIILLTLAVAGLAAWLRPSQSAVPAVSVAARYDQCLARVIAGDKPLDQQQSWASGFCYEQARNAGLASELDVRHRAFSDQAYHSLVILWLVVAITLSGVLLAAAQLWMSFELVSQGREIEASDSEISLERGKIVVRSSITGLLILTISLVFFLVYAIWIFSIEESSPPSSAVMGSGGATAGSNKGPPAPKHEGVPPQAEPKAGNLAPAQGPPAP